MSLSYKNLLSALISRLPNLLVGIFLIQLGLSGLGSVSASDGPYKWDGNSGQGENGSFPQGAVIDSIEIDTRNIYDLTDDHYNNFLFRTANALHRVTRKFVVERELLFTVGDSLDQLLVEETARNLRAGLPINDAWVEVEELSPGHYLVRVVTVDQWSLLGGLRGISRDGNETDYHVGIEERNLLGWSKFLAFDAFFREKRANFVTTTFRDRRFAGLPLSVLTHYSSNPENTVRLVTLSRPFYDLQQRLSWQLLWNDATTKSERYQNDSLEASWVEKTDEFRVRPAYRFGPYNRKTTIGAEYIYHSSQVRDRTVRTGSDWDFFATDSVYHQFNLVLEQTWQRFTKTRHINSFAYDEDITLGLDLNLELGRAFRPEFDDNLYDYLMVEGMLLERWDSWLAGVTIGRSYWFRGDETFRQRYWAQILAYNNALPWVTLAANTTFIGDKSDDPSSVLLGGKSGIRGYDTEYRSGDRLHVVNLESRFYPGLEILSVEFGAVMFLDFGCAWNRGESLKQGVYEQSYGVGLRVSLERLSRTELFRMDLARAQYGNWEISASTGHYF